MEMSDMPVWVKKKPDHLKHVQPSLYQGLIHNGSLTKFLRTYLKHEINIQLKQQGWQAKQHYENMPRFGFLTPQKNYVRKAFLCHDKKPIIYAHAIIPRKIMLNPKTARQIKLGKKPLGDIFQDKIINRKLIDYALIKPQNDLYQQTLVSDDTAIWGRRSLFRIDHADVLIIELFLPAYIECTKK